MTVGSSSVGTTLRNAGEAGRSALDAPTFGHERKDSALALAVNVAESFGRPSAEPEPIAAASSPPVLPPRSAPASLSCADEHERDAEPGPEAKPRPESIGALHRCAHCGGTLPSAHWRRKFCGVRCRVAAHRAARRERGR